MEVVTFYDQLDKLFETGQSGEVGEFLRQSLAETRDSHAVVSVLVEMAGYYRSVSRFQESIAATDRDASFGRALLNAATSYRAASQNGQAEMTKRRGEAV
jgi:hypothetical protein